MTETPPRHLPVYDESALAYEHPLYRTLISAPGLSVAVAPLDRLMHWGTMNSLWVFPMATSCCGIELMAAAASRVDLDRMGTIVRATPRQADVMVVAGTITVKMAPRVKALWEQMPEPKWCIAMGSCAISGDFYRNLYSVVPGIDTILPVDVYVPGCPPNPEALMHGLLRLQEKVRLRRSGVCTDPDPNPSALENTRPAISRLWDKARDPELTALQEDAAMRATSLDASDENEHRSYSESTATLSSSAGSDDGFDLAALFHDEFAVTDFPKDAPPIVSVDRHVALARRLASLGFGMFVYVVATHIPAKAGPNPRGEKFELAYGLRSPGAHSRVATWRLVIDTNEPVPTLVGLFAGADWQEREQYDLVGVRFEGHPDLRRFMLPADWTSHPLRKDFAADAACSPWR